MDASLLSILAWAHAEPGLQSDSAAFVVCLGVGALAWSGPRRACMYVFMYVYMYVWHVSSGRVRQPQSALIAPCGAWLAKPQSRLVAWLGGGLPRLGAWRVERRAHSAMAMGQSFMHQQALIVALCVNVLIPCYLRGSSSHDAQGARQGSHSGMAG